MRVHDNAGPFLHFRSRKAVCVFGSLHERSASTDMQSTSAVLLNFGRANTLSYPGPVSAVNTTAPIISLLSSGAVDERVGCPSDRRFGLQRVRRERLQRSSFFCRPPVKSSKSGACGLHPENNGTYSTCRHYARMKLVKNAARGWPCERDEIISNNPPHTKYVSQLFLFFRHCRSHGTETMRLRVRCLHGWNREKNSCVSQILTPW